MVQSLVTHWGLLRHYWVVLSLWLTSIAVVVLLMHAGSVAAISTRAADPTIDPTQLTGDLPHTLGGLLLVGVPLVLNIYKPRGMTRRGRRHRNRTAAAQHRPLQVGTRLTPTP